MLNTKRWQRLLVLVLPLKSRNKIVSNIAYKANGPRQGEQFPAHSGYANSASYKEYDPSHGSYSNCVKALLGAMGRMSSYSPCQAYTQPQQKTKNNKNPSSLRKLQTAGI